jgi:hypothetical protein
MTPGVRPALHLRVEIFGTVDSTDCGTLNNQGTVEFSGGLEPGSVAAVSAPVVVDGCSGELPAETTAASPADPGAGGLPNTATLAPAPIGLLVATVAAGVVASVLATRARRRSCGPSWAGCRCRCRCGRV